MKQHQLVGAGLGFRADYTNALCTNHAGEPAWLELLADNHFHPAGEALALALSERYPVVLHCVGMNLGGAQDVCLEYLDRVARLARLIGPIHVSDHVAFTAVEQQHHHDLWPLPHTIDVANHVASKVRQVQAYLGRQILIENISSYVRFEDDDMSEAQFVNHITRQADCGLLVDLNNLYVNQHNHEDDAMVALQQLPLERVGYVHLAGFSQEDDLLIDTHSKPPCEDVWGLFKALQTLIPGTPALIEWDDDLPEYETMLMYVNKAHNLITPTTLQMGA